MPFDSGQLSRRLAGHVPNIVEAGFQEIPDPFSRLCLVRLRFELRRPDDGAGVITIVFDLEFGDIVANRHFRRLQAVTIEMLVGIDLEQSLGLSAPVLRLGRANATCALALAVYFRQQWMPLPDVAELADFLPERVRVLGDAHGFHDFVHQVTPLTANTVEVVSRLRRRIRWCRAPR